MNEQEIIDDIRKYGSGIDKRQEGDIDYEMIIKELECNYDYAQKVGSRMVKSGKYKKITVIKPENGRRMVVFRKVD